MFNPLLPTVLSLVTVSSSASAHGSPELVGLWSCARAHHLGLLQLTYMPNPNDSTWRMNDRVSAVRVTFDHVGPAILPLAKGFGTLRPRLEEGELHLAGEWTGPEGRDLVRCRRATGTPRPSRAGL